MFECQLAAIDAYWRAANFLSVGQIYLRANPLVREPLTLDHVKPRLLGHWGTTPGLNFVYVHMNRLIRNHDLDAIFVAGPGHGGPGVVANTYLEGTYSEVYPDVSRDVEGLARPLGPVGRVHGDDAEGDLGQGASGEEEAVNALFIAATKTRVVMKHRG